MTEWKIDRYFPIADMLAKTFGDQCEVVIHDLSTPQNSVVHVANGNVTGRKVGQSFDHLIRQVLLNQNFSDDYAANYYFHTADGRLIKSSTVLLRDPQNRVSGALCINLDTTAFQAAVSLIGGLLPGIRENGAERAGIREKNAGEPKENAEAEEKNSEQEPQNILEIAEELIEKIIGDSDPAAMKREEKIDLIRFMDKKGLFLIRGTVEKVAKRLGISRVTVYSYLDEIKGNRESV